MSASDFKALNLSNAHPDLVVKITVSPDDRGKLLEQDIKNLVSLVEALEREELYCQIRHGVGNSLLVFVKCSKQRFSNAFKLAEQKDWLHGISTDLMSQDSNEFEVSEADRLRIIHSLLVSPVYEGGAGITPGLGKWSFIDSIFPLHDTKLNKAWIKKLSKKKFLSSTDLDQLKDLWGEKVALYFAFIQYYIFWLLASSLIGIFANYALGQFSVVFGLFNLVWGVLYVQFWKAKETALAHRWGVNGSSALEVKRSEFQSESEIKDPITFKQVPYSSIVKRSLKIAVTVPIAITIASVLMGGQLAIFSLEIFIKEVYNGPLKPIVALIPTIALTVVVQVITIVYGLINKRLTAWENHETTNSLQIISNEKTFVLSFLTSYMALLITSFLYLPFSHLIAPHMEYIGTSAQQYLGTYAQTSTKFIVNTARLRTQFIYFMVTNQIIQFALETIVPKVKRFVITKIREYTNGVQVFHDAEYESEFLQEVRLQAELPEYDVHEDYRQTVVQYGYLALFAPVWPLCHLMALINNWVEIRGDATDISLDYKRPIPERVESSEPWTGNLSFLTWLGSVISACITAMFYHLPGTQLAESYEVDAKSAYSLVKIAPWRLLFFVLASEHIYFLVSHVAKFLLKKLPSSEENNSKRTGYVVRENYLQQVLQQDSSSIGGNLIEKRALADVEEDEKVARINDEQPWGQTNVQLLADELHEFKIQYNKNGNEIVEKKEL